MPKNNDIEDMLLSNSSLDELIRQKINDEIGSEIAKAKEAIPTSEITDFKDLPIDMTFSNAVAYYVFNRNTKQESYITGAQAETLLGVQSQTRQKLLNRKIDCFLTDDYYVKFHKASVYAPQSSEGD